MSTTLTQDIIELIAKLSTVQKQRQELQHRIAHYEQKLALIMDSSLVLTNEEQDLTTELQNKGFYIGRQRPPQYFQQSQQQQTISPTSQSQDQILALLSGLFNQQSSGGQQPLATVPTSATGSFGSRNIYNFPQPSPPINGLGPITLSPTSAPVWGRGTK